MIDNLRAAIVDAVRDEAPDLTMRQLAVFLIVYLEPGPHTVRGLAAALGVPKPAVTRALQALERLGLLRRWRDGDDGRNVLASRTTAGNRYLTAWARCWRNLPQ